jgi:poly(3-hydroxybutyrate) depolymerase
LNTLLKTENGQVPGGHAYTISFFGSGGTAQIAKVQVTGMLHAWSGGPVSAEWFDTTGPNASEMIWQFLNGQGI